MFLNFFCKNTKDNPVVRQLEKMKVKKSYQKIIYFSLIQGLHSLIVYSAKRKFLLQPRRIRSDLKNDFTLTFLGIAMIWIILYSMKDLNRIESKFIILRERPKKRERERERKRDWICYFVSNNFAINVFIGIFLDWRYKWGILNNTFN